jgi:8-amino-7-oxononanoate synthase
MSLRHLEKDLDDLARAGLLRSDAPPTLPEGLVHLCSNDYLGYAAEAPGVLSAPAGAGASRLVFGDHPAHRAAESALAAWLGVDASLLFSSGYAANVGTISALAHRGDVIVSDALNHASIIDGCRLSGASVRIVPHRSASAVEEALASAHAAPRRWVVTESYFSMDGDAPDLARLRAACDRHDASLIVDEAHAVGVFGPRGTGLCAAAGVVPDVLVGTLGKALGLQGAFVAGSRALRSWLWNRARSFVFSTGVSPAVAELVRARVERVAGDDARRVHLFEAVRELRDAVSEAGGVVPDLAGPIVPWILGGPDAAVRAAMALRDRGLLVQPIRPPTVPMGTARLRLTASAALGSRELSRVREALRRFT